MYDTDYYTPEQFNVYIERKNFEYKTQQKWLCNRNTLQIGLDKVDEINKILQRYMNGCGELAMNTSTVRELLELKRRIKVNNLS